MLIQVERVSFWVEHSLGLPLGTNEKRLVLDEVDLCDRLGLQLSPKKIPNQSRQGNIKWNKKKNVKLEANGVLVLASSELHLYRRNWM